MRKIQFEQGSGDWILWRNQGIGSSDAAIILLGSHFGKTKYDLWLEKTTPSEKIPSGKKENSAMKHGRKKEPEVRKLYEEWTGTQAPPLCGVHEEHEFLKVSLDGWVNDSLIVEIKCPGVRRDGSCDHFDALDGKVPDKYVPQLLHQCLVTGVRKAHYVSWGDPKHFKDLDTFRIVPFQAGEKELQALLTEELAFWQCVLNRTPPQ